MAGNLGRLIGETVSSLTHLNLAFYTEIIM